jgi:hypothetical protein
VVEHVVAEGGSDGADDYRVGPTSGLLERFEVVFDFLVHDQRDAVVAALAAVPDGERRGGDQLAVVDSEPEAGDLYRLVLDVQYAVEVDEQRADRVEHRSRHRRSPTAVGSSDENQRRGRASFGWGV